MKTIILALLVLMTGCSSYEERVRDNQFYCYMVDQEHWPAYDYDIDCTGSKE